MRDPGVGRARVERVVSAGARIADRRDPLGAEARRRLPGATGLSPEGVELALTEHLEVHPTAAELDALVASAGQAPRCVVVLSANVCTAALRALAVAAATAPEVLARPSRRDPVVAELLARALADDPRFEGRIELIESIGRGAPGDELHAYGTDETIAALRAEAGPDVVVRGHGAGMGVAIVGADADVAAAAEGLAADVVPFDQRGCLSPRAALVEGPPERAEALAGALHEALERAALRVPRGPLGGAIRAEIAMYRATMEAIGAFREGGGGGVGLDPAPRALLVPPAARVVHVAPASAEGAAALLAPWAPAITALGAAGAGPLLDAARDLLPRARRSPLGRMQRPPLDGPVDLRAPCLRAPCLRAP